MSPIISCIQKFVDFHGRSSLVEFWSFFMFLCILQMIGFFIDVSMGYIRYNWIGIFPFCPVMESIRILSLVPFLAVLTRRLHDIGKPTKYIFIFFIPVVGFLVLLPLLIQPSLEDTTPEASSM
jgi:uncharacterized membrane protein YhaH (DUF805 family)